MAWLYLIIAGVLETGWAIGLKYSEGFTRLWPSVLTVAMMIPLGTAYAVWTGIGTVGTVLLGILLFNEPVEALRLTCIGLIVAGVVGLRVLSPH
jgi:quaternary ammonium compound-resistance protein SugE